MQRWVIHIDMDAFFTSVEQLTRPTLRGRPVLVCGMNGRGVVAGASYEARVYGVKSAMPSYQALALVGFKAVPVLPRHAVYAAASKRIFKILERYSEVVEKISIDEGFLEPEVLVGASEEEVRTWAEELRAVIYQEAGLPASIGAGSGKQFAKIGSELAKPNGVFVCSPDKHEELIYPLPVGQLWGVGAVTKKKLNQLGVETIGDLAKMSEKEVEISLGVTIGKPLWLMARGIDDRVVEPRAIAKQISSERTYPKDLIVRSQVDIAIQREAEKAHRRLLKDGRGARTVTVKLKTADFRIQSRSMTLPYATDDVTVLSLIAKQLVRYPGEVGPIRLVGVSYSGLEIARQGMLFSDIEWLASVKEKTNDSSDFEVGVQSQVQLSVLPTTIDTQAELPEVLSGWYPTQDVHHEDYGHGWIQGVGHGKITVRFETRSTTQSIVRTFDANDPQLSQADPLISLDWDLSSDNYLEENEDF
ncbi:DNA polymerase IV [Corynebacterium kutscheri]|uniref:DNA polymerase IV n=1 Tax=Corynebacterium kutscheri TaxID=35755 RepID=A0A0F6TE56_9CORY|nr:DNA polymerase IV [Corynebacterium kutscheri]AKE41549.1 nucleotidyltransferase/DNA polymerase involved in DNA repair [Corynebacterium kutscheri]VEH08828.1 DNA polymerase IV [Corynebacterium kutscheri]VEH09873.1 DNA polymerase IV [Corynebacterium kutscheri]VEH79957.1 DNA polymerase IV [Corynebacterium kutscheri]